MAEAEKQPFSYNLKRLAFHLRRKVEDFKPFKSRDTGSPGHSIELGSPEGEGFKTTIAFCEDGTTTVVIKLLGSRRIVNENMLEVN